MPRILLVKTSSLGDVVHNLPVVSDIRRAIPDATVDWVVEEAFAAIPRLHAAVEGVIPVALRRWRRSPFRAETRAEARNFFATLRARAYDAVVDTQGLLKSALIARAARGFRHGLDWASSREPLALFYDRTYRVPWTMHAVARNRTLASLALGYRAAAEIDYGIGIPERPGDRAILLHATSAASKFWAEQNWIALGRKLSGRGLFCVLPWGSDEERSRSERLCAEIPGSIVPPRQAPDELAREFARARIVIGVDTGLTHLAAALGVPTIGIYCATDPAATGIYGCERARNLGGIGTPPELAEVIETVSAALA